MNGGMAGQQNVGAFLHFVSGGAASAQFDSGTASPGATSTGIQVDRLDTTFFPKRYNSAVCLIPSTLTMATGTGRSYSLVATVKERATTASVGSTWAALATGTLTVAQSTTTFNAVTKFLAIKLNLKQAKRFLKVNYHKAFGTTVTGTLVSVGAPIYVLGGSDEAPAA